MFYLQLHLQQLGLELRLVVVTDQGLAPGQLHLQGVDPGGIPLLLGNLLQLLLILTHLLEDLRPPVLLPSVLIVASLR